MMEPTIFFGLFTLFTIYSLWYPIPLTTINPRFPLPARIARTIQLTATTNSAVSMFRNVMWPDSNPRPPSNESLPNNITPLINDQLQEFLDKWDYKLEKHITENAERPVSTVTSYSTPTPTLQAMMANIIEPQSYPDPLDYNSWVGYTFYQFAEKEVRRNPNMYTLAAIFILVNYWLVRSARRSEVREELEAVKEVPIDKIKELRDELIAHNARLHLVEVKVEGLALADDQRRFSRTASRQIPQVGESEQASTEAQTSPGILPACQPGKPEFDSLQEQLTEMRQDLVSLKSNSETRSEHLSENIASVMSTIKELQKESESTSRTRIMNDAVSVKKSVFEDLKSELTPLSDRISDIEAYSSSSRGELGRFAIQVSQIMESINVLRREFEKVKRKLSAELASIKTEISREHKLELDAVEKQIIELRQTACLSRDELDDHLSQRISSIMGIINEAKEDSASGVPIDSVKKEMASLKSSLKVVEHAMKEIGDETKNQDVHHLRVSLEALQAESTRSLQELSSRLDMAMQDIQVESWRVKHQQFDQWIAMVESKLQGLEHRSLTESNLLPVLSQLEALNTKVDLNDSLFKRVEDECATKFEQKSLYADVKHLEGRVNQLESIPQKDPSSTMKEEHIIKLRDLGKSCVDLRSEIGEIKDTLTALISDEIPKHRSETLDKLTESVRLSTSQIEKDIEARYAHKEDVLKCLNSLQLDGKKPIDLQRLKKDLSEIENYAYATQNNLNLAIERITDNEQHIETLREGNATNYKDIRRCLDKLGISGTIVPLSAPIKPKPVPGESKPPVHIDLSVGKKFNSQVSSSSLDRGDKNISRFDPRYKGDDKPVGSDIESNLSKRSEPLKKTSQGKNISRYDPRYQGSDKFRKSFPEPGSSEASKAEGKLNLTADSFVERPKSSGDRSRASRASVAQSEFAGKEKTEVEMTTAKEKPEEGEDAIKSLVEITSRQEQQSEREEKDVDSMSVSDDNGDDAPDTSAEPVSSKSPEIAATTESEDKMEM